MVINHFGEGQSQGTIPRDNPKGQPPKVRAYNSLQYKTLRPTFPHPGDPSTNHFGYNGTTGCTAHFPDRAHFSDFTRCISLDFTSYNHNPSLPRCPIFFSTF